MEGNHGLYVRDLAELNEFYRLLPRDGCVQCDSTESLTCPSCPEGQSCQYNIPTDDCTQCPTAVCRQNELPPDSDESNDAGSVNEGGAGGGTNIGAIVGGVIGGIIVIAIVAYLTWRFLIKPKRAESSHYSAYIIEPASSHGGEKDGASQLTRRSSTHTVHSIASTVLTRASNIIQIAYIPGVTNRANPSEPGVLVPPVPPIPMQHSGNQDPGNEEQHFFVPGDLRDSTYSGLSGYSDRTSYARTSYAPRSSIASTIYGKQAQVMTGTQTGMRAKPTMVSVKTVGPGGSTPPVPSINFEKFNNGRPKSGASTFSVGSTFLNNANTATPARAQVVKVSGLKKIDVGSKSDASSTTTSSSDAPEVVHEAASITLVNDTASVPALRVDQGPFADPPSGPATPRVAPQPTLGAVAEADSDDEHSIAELSSSGPRSVQRGPSPFGDEHATK